MDTTQMVPTEKYDVTQRRPSGRSGGGILLAFSGLALVGLTAAAFAATASGKKQRVRRRRDLPLTPEPPRKEAAPPPSPGPARPADSKPPAPTTEIPTSLFTDRPVVFAPRIFMNDMPDWVENWGDQSAQTAPPRNTGIVGPNVGFPPEPAQPGPLTGDAEPGDPLVPNMTPAQYSDAWLAAYRQGYAYGKTLKPSQANTKIVSLATFAGMRAGALGQPSKPPAAGPDRRDYLQGYDQGKAIDQAQLIEIMRGEASALGSLDAVRGLAQRTAPAVLA